jgi:2-polyprenyl-3-methyl-5-hydroxy-6-metoxy-1,4-benzoquinol methylase
MNFKSKLVLKINDIRLSNTSANILSRWNFKNEVLPLLQTDSQVDSLILWDWGCGFGEETKQACKIGFKKIYSFDITKYPAFETVLEQEKHVVFTLISEDVKYETIERPDIIVCHHVLEHIDDDCATLKFFHNFIKEGGLLLLCVPPITNLTTLKRRLFGKNAFSDPTHVREYTIEEVQQKLVNEKFSVMNLFTSGFGVPFPGFAMMARLIDPDRFVEKKIWFKNILFTHDSINVIARK